MNTEAPQKRAPRSPSTSLVVLVFAMAIFIVVTQLWPRFQHGWAVSRLVTARGELSPQEESTIDVFASASPSAVFVANAMEKPISYRETATVVQGSGTGFIWDEIGHIVTNLHVVRGADRLVITLADHTPYNADLIGYSTEHDIAVLRIAAPPAQLFPIPIGTSNDLRVGQSVFAIGNPFGLDQTLTTGIISALDRNIVSNSGQRLTGLVQTDAAINPGNSGGPLLDSAGRLIGVNTAIVSPTGTNAGIGFAIPVDIVNEIVPDIINHGRPMKPFLGVNLRTIRINDIDRVMIFAVTPGSAADKAGLKGASRIGGRIITGDFILEIDGQPILIHSDVTTAIRKHKIGDNLSLKIQRNEEILELAIRLEAATDDR